MSEPMKKHRTKNQDTLEMHCAGEVYKFPKKIAEKYRVKTGNTPTELLFSKINKQFTKPGALLKGIRLREELTQIQMAKKIKVTQSDISQMENGTRKIGRKIAQRIETLFDIDYRLFLD